jgi:hypothetical protein
MFSSAVLRWEWWDGFMKCDPYISMTARGLH